MATRIKKIFSVISLPKNEERTNTDWKSIYIATFVAFLAATQSYNVWPYIKFINPEITETANGIFQGTAALGGVITSTVAGFLVNKYSTTKPHLIVAELLTIIAAFFYMGVELNVNVAVILIIIFHALRGIAGGFGSVYRTHISMATAESERGKAFGLALFATAIGSIIGSISQMLFSLIPYPGLSLFFGIHFNLFTAPVFLTFITSAIGALLLLFFFNGKLHASKKEEEKEEIENQEGSSKTAQESFTEIVEGLKYDKTALIILIITRVIQNINALVILSIAVPYSMAVFKWSSKDVILFQSILMAITGLFSVAFSFVYIRYNLVKWIPERFAIICGLGIFFLFYFMTFPWWFLSSTIPYAHVIGAPAYFSQQEAAASLIALNQTGELVGCNITYSWCESTKQINIVVFAIFAILALGIASPISAINLDILFSKVLGPIKQGLWQGILQASVQLINIIGPFLVTLIYIISGPFWLWLFELVTTSICIILLIAFYPRLISYTITFAQKLRLVPFFLNILKDNMYLVTFDLLINTYVTSMQFVGHLLLAFNRFTIICFPTSYNKIWEKQWYIFVLIILPFFAICWRLHEPIIFLFAADGSVTAAVFQNSNAAKISNILQSTIYISATILASLLNVSSFMKFIFHRKNNGSSINIKEKHLLYVSFVTFISQCLRITYNINGIFFSANLEMVSTFNTLLPVLNDIFAWSGTISLLFLSVSTRKAYKQFYLCKSNQISASVHTNASKSTMPKVSKSEKPKKLPPAVSTH